jgi:phage terminase large subunit-like protein
LAVERHLNDLKNKDCEYTYSEAHATRAFNFISASGIPKENLLGKGFNIQPFQEFFIKVLFGGREKMEADDFARHTLK